MGLDPCLSFAFAFFSSFFFFSCYTRFEWDKFTVHILFNTGHALFQYYSHTIHETHSHFIKKIYIKNGSHGTIYTFKIYFVTIFSVLSFQFQQK